MRKKVKQSSLKKYYRNLNIICTVLTLVFLGGFIGVGIPYLISKDPVLLIILYVTLGALAAVVIVSMFLIVRNNYNIFYSNFYKITKDNISLISKDSRVLIKYQNEQFDEFLELNNEIDKLTIHNAAILISSRTFDYSKIPLEYLDRREHLLNESSFRRGIREIVYCSEYLRNAIISISYEGPEGLNAEFIKEIVHSINHLLDYKGTLIALKDKSDGFYIYVPAIESLSSLKATLDNLLQKITVSLKTVNGIELSSPKISTVVYPFTSIEDIFSDLQYADSEEKHINIYLPDRFIHSKNESSFRQSSNVKTLYKIMGQLSNVIIDSSNFDSFLDEIKEVMSQVGLYYNFDQAGVIMYDKERKKSGGSIAITLDESQTPIFAKEKAVKDEFVKAVIDNTDKDRSLFFSKRKLASSSLGAQMDIYGISSGFMYEVTDVQDKFAGLIYFININKKEAPLDSYLQSTLVVFSNLLTGLLRNFIVEENVTDMREREQSLLKLTNIRSYVIDRLTYKVISFSPSLKRDIPDLEVGQLCYRTMFGFEKPCPSCPLITKQKAIKRIRGNDYEVGSVLNSKLSTNTELILTGVKTDSLITNRFDKDYLTNTYYSFVERLSDLYLAKARGYVALLKINNVPNLIEGLGNEGYSYIIRKFTRDIDDKILNNNEIYSYKNNTIALIFSQSGKLDAIDAIEKVYSLSKKEYLKDKQNHELVIAYDITKYPQEHNDASDFIRHLEQLCSRKEANDGHDSLYIEEDDFSRPASKEEYILNIINQATISNNFIIKCQPIVASGTKAIFSSELLIRLSDEFQNSLLNTEEVISVSAKYGKLHNISDILIDYVGNLFKQYSLSIFKPAGFVNMSINADYNYFKDEESIRKILDAMAKYKLPKTFLTFEVTEKEIATHYDAFKDIVSTLHRNDINIVCDRYYGNNLSFEKLKLIGIDTIKTDRSIIANIDINSEKFSNLSKLIESASLNTMKVTLVGVENGEQYNLIKSLNYQCNLQGYYFHHPLSGNELIEAIRVDNVM